MTHYSTLLSPGRIGTLELRNRIFQTAMGTALSNEDGTISDEVIAFYEARAAGGTALQTMGAVGVSYPHGRVQSRQPAISDDRYIPGLKKMTAAVHRHGGRIAAQLHSGGVCAVMDMVAGYPIWCASEPQGDGHPPDVMLPEERALAASSKITQMPTFKALDEEDIALLVRQFADGAARAVEAGFDGVEIHGAHGYIISSFLSPDTNRRTDGYGGTRENRTRLLREIITAIRDRVGRDFPVWCKLDGAEFYIENALTPEDVCFNAQVAEAAGADAITVSARHNYAIGKALTESWLPQTPGKLIPLAERVKAAVNVPVITAGRIEPEVADKAIRDGKFDFLAMGRKLIADPDFVRHLRQGGSSAVRPCIYCYVCLSQAMLHQPLRCAVNGDVGYEKDTLLAPAETPRRVVVVGGGPGGMESARRLSLRGHQVTLLEAASQLGGTARIATIAYEPNGKIVDWLKRQMNELDVDVRLNTTATAENVMALKPDSVVVATGAIRRAPPIPGAHQPFVHDGASLRALLLGEGEEGEAKGSLVQRLAAGAARAVGATNNANLVRQASKFWMPIGDRVVIIGGELVGLELAEFLHERGRQVSVVDEAAQFGAGLSMARRTVMLDQMREAKLPLFPGATDIAIGQQEVRFTDRKGQSSRLAADTVIIAKGAEANLGLYEALVARGLEVHSVGDCGGVGYIHGAIRTAADVTSRI